MNRFHALIPAAGSGARMGGEVPKQYLDVRGFPVIAHTLAALARDPRVEQLVVVLSPDDAWWDAYDWSGWAGRLQALRCGGATRAETVLNGLEAMTGGCAADDWVLVHDAARPCLEASALERLREECGEPHGGLLALPCTDTLKRAKGSKVVETVDRAFYWRAQTPQLFPLALLSTALQECRAHDLEVTDEASAMERAGYKPRLVRGHESNLKVTYPEDLPLAEFWLSRRERHP